MKRKTHDMDNKQLDSAAASHLTAPSSMTELRVTGLNAFALNVCQQPRATLLQQIAEACSGTRILRKMYVKIVPLIIATLVECTQDADMIYSPGTFLWMQLAATEHARPCKHKETDTERD